MLAKAECTAQILFDGRIYAVFSFLNEDGIMRETPGMIIKDKSTFDGILKAINEQLKEAIDMSLSPFKEAIPDDIEERLDGKQPA